MSTAAAHLCVCLFSNKSLFSPPSGQPEDDCSNRAISNLSEKPPEREPLVLYSLPLSTSNINQGLPFFWVIIKVALIFHANSNDCFYPLLKAGSLRNHRFLLSTPNSQRQKKEASEASKGYKVGKSEWKFHFLERRCETSSAYPLELIATSAPHYCYPERLLPHLPAKKCFLLSSN